MTSWIFSNTPLSPNYWHHMHESRGDEYITYIIAYVDWFILLLDCVIH